MALCDIQLFRLVKSFQKNAEKMTRESVTESLNAEIGNNLFSFTYLQHSDEYFQLSYFNCIHRLLLLLK